MRLLCVLAVLVVVPGVVIGADTCVVSIGDVLGTAGTEIQVPVMLSVDFPSQAYSFGLVHDPAQLTAVDIVPGAAIATIRGGQGPEFFNKAVYTTDVDCAGTAVQGVSAACLYDFSLVDLIGPADVQEIAVVTYTPVISSGTATLRFQECLGDPVVTLRVVKDNLPVTTCEFAEGTIHMVAAGLSVSGAPQGTAGDALTCDVQLTTEGDTGAGGFSFAVRHDAEIATLDAIDFDAQSVLAGHQAGAGPDFFSTAVYPDGWDCGGTTVFGGSVECIIDDTWNETLPIGGPHTLVTLHYTASPAGIPGTTEVSFATDGCAPGDVPTTVRFTDTLAVQPATSGTTLTVTGVPFIRGDTNHDTSVDISDAVCILSYLFGANGCASLTCLESADSNGDGGIDVADAIFELGYLFGEGPVFPLPFPACGIADTYIEGCTVFPVCQ